MSLLLKRTRVSQSFRWTRLALTLSASFFLAGGNCFGQSDGAEKKPELRPTAKAVIKQKSSGELNDITFDTLKFDLEPGAAYDSKLLTKEINQLDGQKIKLRGYIRPSFKQTGITKFVFVRDNQACCFGPGAALYDCVLVELNVDKPTDYTVRPVSIVGEFFLKEFKGPDGNIWAIYRMRNAVVE